MSASPTPIAQARPLRGADHDRGLQALQVQVVAVAQPCASVLRLVVQLPEQTDTASWQRANTAVRIQLGAAFGDVSRIYTVRSVDTATRQFTLDVVLHEAPGPMLAWVRALRCGDAFDLTGPRPHLQVPHREGTCALLFADQSAIPALFALLQQWPTGLQAQAWIASDDAFPVDELPAIEGVCVHRLAIGHAPLLQQARQLRPEPGSTVWAAGEREEMRALRRHFIETVGLPRSDVAVAGYWKRGETTTETDQRRRRNYERVLARGGGLQDLDDLADDI
ncbi:siderophore-interacting protein [Stenotrophomonas riyadhensis]|uniref:Siderophore-interacting protein n=1 Tax=Stenotrophomonas maltophilia TaxID=40324 RepID=A0AAI9BYM5_STEMA|nr:siderophore-interacting protein [Stenotrophomonas maltophilia]HEL4103412.1 siderophore-interacting protein [Stenotrophomonas maltophilia]HEL5045174.1 siderophore-interacting protein [Stenotrophomonas maltophilia]